MSIRLIACFTQLSYSHPDEWYQTVELGHFISSGMISQTQEFFLHIRNLTWPSLISAAFSFSEKIFPNHVFARFTMMKLLTALMDLGLVWGWMQMVVRRTQGLPSFWAHLGCGMLILCPMMVAESVRPSQEHLSAVAFWVALGFSVSRRFFLSGVAGALTGVFRYPSGLLGLGLFFCGSRKWLVVVLGLGLGAVLGGFADFWIYGRPYESFWMYLQYNVWSGLAARNFGVQTVGEYGRYLYDVWRGPLLPIGVLFVLTVPVGWGRGLLKKEIWAWSLLFYVLGHSVGTAHKEPRFMAPVFVLFLWASFEGVLTISQFKKHRFLETWMRSRWVRVLLLGVALGWGASLVRALWGETWRMTDNYLEVSRHIAESDAKVCAVISVRRPASFLLPTGVPYGFFPADRSHSSFLDRETRPLIWLNRQAQCEGESERVLLQPYRPDAQWELQENCRLLSSGILRWVPRSSWGTFLERGWVAAPWYRCPSQVLAGFRKPEVRKILATEMPLIKSLPSVQASAEEILELLQKQGNGFVDGTLGDY